MSYKINKVAVLGSGTMGAQIAAHCANAGFEVLLLDIAPKELTKQEEARRPGSAGIPACLLSHNARQADACAPRLIQEGDGS